MFNRLCLKRPVSELGVKRAVTAGSLDAGPGFSSSGIPARAAPIANDMAPVVLTSMKTELHSAVMGAPIMAAYSPCAG